MTVDRLSVEPTASCQWPEEPIIIVVTTSAVTANLNACCVGLSPKAECNYAPMGTPK